MGKMLKIVSFAIMFFCLPFVISAKSIESDLSFTTDIIEKIDMGNVYITNVGYTQYSNMLSTGKEGAKIIGTVNNNYDRNIEIEIAVHLYDKNKKLLEKRIEVVGVEARANASFEQIIYEDELDSELSNVKYYSLVGNVLSDVEILDKSKKDNYYLENYNIIVDVSINNVYKIDESFDAIFSSHVDVLSKGIPYRVEYVRQNGDNVTKRAVISDVKVNDSFKLETEKGIRYIKIGDINRSLKEKDYNLSYKYNVGKDTLNGKDEFIFYLSNNLPEKTDGITFSVIMPKNFVKENVMFVDENGLKVDNVTYEVNGRVINGTIDGVINPGTNYAISILLPDGYFQMCSSNISKYTWMAVIVPIVLLLLSVLIWVINKKLKNRVSYNSIYFNENINSLEVGYLYNGHVKDNDIASLLFCLANKGYIDIIFEKKNYTIVKKAEYKGNDRVEKVFMKELFFAKDKVSKYDLLDSLTDMKSAISIKIDKSKKEKKIYSRKVLNWKILFWIFIAIILVLNTVNILIEYQPSLILLNSVTCVGGFILLINSLLSKDKIIEKFLYSLVALILIIAPIVLTSYEAFLVSDFYLVIYMLGIIVSIAIGCIASLINNRTMYGNKILNKINAYKNYLVNCKNNEIEKALKTNPNSMYDVLPYALVLGIGDKWIDKHRKKKIKKPKWYYNKDFDLASFYTNIMNIYSDMFLALKNEKNNN